MAREVAGLVPAREVRRLVARVALALAELAWGARDVGSAWPARALVLVVLELRRESAWALPVWACFHTVTGQRFPRAIPHWLTGDIPADLSAAFTTAL